MHGHGHGHVVEIDLISKVRIKYRLDGQSIKEHGNE